MKKFMKINSCRRLNSIVGTEKRKQFLLLMKIHHWCFQRRQPLPSSSECDNNGGQMMKRCFPLEAAPYVNAKQTFFMERQAHRRLPSFSLFSLTENHKLSRSLQPAHIDAFEKLRRLLRRVRLAYKLRNLFKRLEACSTYTWSVQLQSYQELLLDERESERWEKVKLVDFPSVPSTAFGKERRKLIEFLKTLFFIGRSRPSDHHETLPKEMTFLRFYSFLPFAFKKHVIHPKPRRKSRQTFPFLDQRKREKINFHPFGFGRNQQSLFRKQLPRSFLEHQY